MLTLTSRKLRDLPLPIGTGWLLADCMEARGQQDLWMRQKPRLIEALRALDIIQSVESSNRIEGVRGGQLAEAVKRLSLRPGIAPMAVPPGASYHGAGNSRNASSATDSGSGRLPLRVRLDEGVPEMTIRFRLTVIFVAVILVANVILALFTVTHIGRVWLEEVQTRVRLDLNSARAAYDGRRERLGLSLRATSLDPRLRPALLRNDHPTLDVFLREVWALGDTDMLTLVDVTGRVLARAHEPGRRGDNLLHNALIAMAIQERRLTTGTVILPAESLAREGPDLANRARFELLPTPAARPTDETSRADGMVVGAALPIQDADGGLLGILFAGDLLNRRHEIVDSIRDEVFSSQVYEGREIGTVTVFKGDLRISTNVKRVDGTRATGTRLSEQVYGRVLEEGETWADRAFVVNDWYITAYEPIRDPAGRIIGALYVGLLEAPFVHRERMIVGTFLGLVTATTLISLLLLFLMTAFVLRPIGRITGMSRRVIDGDLTARVGIKPPGEMGVLCRAIDAMADAVAKREEQLERATRQQIGQSEKMASVGRLAAGIAHEINNPLTGVLTFAHLLRDKANMNEQDRQDLDLIINETTRVAEIVRGLLDFARASPSLRQPLDINNVIRHTMRLVRTQKPAKDILIHEALGEDIPEVYGDRNQLQQVLLNLSLNACEAMPDGGTLTVRSLEERGQVRVQIEDTGCGIAPDHLQHIFDPFFTTKPIGKGTGLGLSVSYGIVQQHEGTLDVESEEGKGTVFTIALPLARRHGVGDPIAGRQA